MLNYEVMYKNLIAEIKHASMVFHETKPFYESDFQKGQQMASAICGDYLDRIISRNEAIEDKGGN